MNDPLSELVQVFVRIRPEQEEFIKSNSKKDDKKLIKSNDGVSVEQLDDKVIRIRPPDGFNGQRKTVAAVDDKTYTFDRVFSQNSNQEDIYQQISPLVKAVVNGFNATVFAYGCTGSGKSYTMTGNNNAPGIIPRAISEIFSIVERTTAMENDVLFYVRISYVELYNNNFRNLLGFASKDPVYTQNLAMSREKTDVNSSWSDLDPLNTSMSQNSPLRSISRTSSRNNLESLNTNTSQTTPRRSLSRSSSRNNSPIRDRESNTKIEVRESQSAGVFLSGPNLRVPVTSAHEAFQLIAKGNKLRAVGSTQCNDESSRSHAILTIHVESRHSMLAEENQEAEYGKNTARSNMGSSSSSKKTSKPGAVDLRLGKMHLVDLAGSERLTLSGSEGDALVETQNINLSLSALGDVLSALSKNASAIASSLKQSNATSYDIGYRFDGRNDYDMSGDMTPTQSSKSMVSSSSKSLNLASVVPTVTPVPYRNSKLTHLLKDSLGGNSKTIMITNIRVGSEYYQQTSISLMYASRAKKIKNYTTINRNVLGDTGILAVTSEIERLRSRLDQRTEEFQRLRKMHQNDSQENVILKKRFEELKYANEAERNQLEAQMKHIIHSQAGQLVNQTKKLSELQLALQDELLISQNRIAEQEREITWLKQALDDTTYAAQQPVDQLERMQKVVDAWQSQAKTTQTELKAALSQSDSLKSQNIKLTLLLNEAQMELKQLNATNNAYSQNDKNFQQQSQNLKTEIEQLKLKLGKYEVENETLKNNLKLTKEEYNKNRLELAEKLTLKQIELDNMETQMNEQHSQLALKLSSADKLNIELNGRLSTALDSLQKASSSETQTVLNLTDKLLQKDTALRDAEFKINSIKTTYDMLSDNYEKLNKRLLSENDDNTRLNEMIKNEKEKFQNLKNDMHDLELKLQTSSNMIQEMNLKAFDSETAFKKEIQLLKFDLQSELNKFDQIVIVHNQEIKNIQIQNEQRMQQIVTENTSKLMLTTKQMENDSTNEIKKFKQQYDDLIDTMKEDFDSQEKEHLDKIEDLRNECDQIYKDSIVKLEKLKSKYEHQNKEELDQLELKYNTIIAEANSNHSHALSEAVDAERQQNKKQLDITIEEYESKLQSVKTHYESEINLLQDKLNASEESIMQEKLALQHIQNQSNDTEKEQRQQIEQLKSQFEQRRKEELDQLELKYNTIIAEANSNHSHALSEAVDAERQQNKKQLDITIEEYESKLQSVKTHYESEINLLQDKLNASEESIMQEKLALQHIQNQSNDTEKEQRQQIEQLKSQFEQRRKEELDQLELKYNTIIAEANSNHSHALSEAVDAERQQNKKQLDITIEEYESKLQSVKTHYESEINLLQDKLNASEESIMQEKLALQHIQNQSNDTEKEQRQQIEQLKSQFEQRRKEELDQLEVKYNSIIAEANSNHSHALSEAVDAERQQNKKQLDITIEEYESKLQSVKTHYESESQLLRTKFEADKELFLQEKLHLQELEKILRTELDEKANNNKEQTDQLKLHFERQLEDELKALQSKHNNDMITENNINLQKMSEAIDVECRKHKKQLDATVEEYELKLLSMKAHYETETQILRENFEIDKEMFLREKLAQQELEHVDIIQSLRKQLEESIKYHNQLLEQNNQQYKDELSQLELKYHNTMAKTNEEQFLRITQTIEEKNLQYKQQLDTTIEKYESILSSAKSQYESQVKLLEEKFEAEKECMLKEKFVLQSETESKEQKYLIIIEQFRSQYDQSYADYIRHLEELKSQYEEKLSEQQELFDEERMLSSRSIESANKEQEQEMTKIMDSFEKERTQYKQQLSETLVDYENKLSIAKKEYEIQFDSLKATLETERDAALSDQKLKLIEEFSNEIKNEKEKYEKILHETILDNEKLLVELTASLDTKHQSHLASEILILETRLKDVHMKQIQSIEENYRQQENLTVEKYRIQLNETEVEWQKRSSLLNDREQILLKDLQSSLEKKYENELKIKESDFHEKNVNIVIEYESKLEEELKLAKLEWSQLTDKMIEERIQKIKQQHDEYIVSINNKHQIEISQLKESFTDTLKMNEKDKSNSFNQELDMLKMSHENEILSLKQRHDVLENELILKHSSEISKLHEYNQEAMDQLKKEEKLKYDQLLSHEKELLFNQFKTQQSLLEYNQNKLIKELEETRQYDMTIAIEKLKNEHESNLNNTLHKMAVNHKTQLDEIVENQVNIVTANYKAILTEKNDILESLNKQLTQFKAKFQSNIYDSSNTTEIDSIDHLDDGGGGGGEDNNDDDDGKKSIISVHSKSFSPRQRDEIEQLRKALMSQELVSNQKITQLQEEHLKELERQHSQLQENFDKRYNEINKELLKLREKKHNGEFDLSSLSSPDNQDLISHSQHSHMDNSIQTLQLELHNEMMKNALEDQELHYKQIHKLLTESFEAEKRQLRDLKLKDEEKFEFEKKSLTQKFQDELNANEVKWKLTLQNVKTDAEYNLKNKLFALEQELSSRHSNEIMNLKSSSVSFDNSSSLHQSKLNNNESMHSYKQDMVLSLAKQTVEFEKEKLKVEQEYQMKIIELQNQFNKEKYDMELLHRNKLDLAEKKYEEILELCLQKERDLNNDNNQNSINYFKQKVTETETNLTQKMVTCQQEFTAKENKYLQQIQSLEKDIITIQENNKHHLIEDSYFANEVDSLKNSYEDRLKQMKTDYETQLKTKIDNLISEKSLTENHVNNLMKEISDLKLHKLHDQSIHSTIKAHASSAIELSKQQIMEEHERQTVLKTFVNELQMQNLKLQEQNKILLSQVEQQQLTLQAGVSYVDINGKSKTDFSETLNSSYLINANKSTATAIQRLEQKHNNTSIIKSDFNSINRLSSPKSFLINTINSSVQKSASLTNTDHKTVLSKSSTPSDHLIAGILDGDIQGIRTIVRTHGNDLLCDYWKPKIKNILPLHRAFSGLHFHGNQKLLLATINCLLNLNVDIDLKDRDGSIALHKALQVCPSKNVIEVLKLLLAHHMDPNITNKSNEMALHIECKRLRSASPEVVDLLIQHTKDLNVSAQILSEQEISSGKNTPLSLVLEQAKLSAYTLEELVSRQQLSNQSLLTENARDNSLKSSPVDKNEESNTIHSKSKNKDIPSLTHSPSTRKVWIKVATLLVKSGAIWNPLWRNKEGSSMMHLLMSVYPPPRKLMYDYMQLVNSAIVSGMDLNTDDSDGQTPIFILCERFSMISTDSYPDALDFMKSLIHIAKSMSVHSQSSFELFSNCMGKTVFDLPEYVNSSCLSASKPFFAELAMPSAESKITDFVEENELENTEFRNQLSNIYSPLTSSPSSELQNSLISSKFPKFERMVSLNKSTVKPFMYDQSLTSSQLLSSYYNISQKPAK